MPSSVHSEPNQNFHPYLFRNLVLIFFGYFFHFWIFSIIYIILILHDLEYPFCKSLFYICGFLANYEQANLQMIATINAPVQETNLLSLFLAGHVDIVVNTPSHLPENDGQEQNLPMFNQRLRILLPCTGYPIFRYYLTESTMVVS